MNLQDKSVLQLEDMYKELLDDIDAYEAAFQSTRSQIYSMYIASKIKKYRKKLSLIEEELDLRMQLN